MGAASEDTGIVPAAGALGTAKTQGPRPGNTKFLGLGSGLQRKFGEVTMARNDPAGTVPEPESRRFMAAVRRARAPEAKQRMSEFVGTSEATGAPQFQ
ncbi:unnamed protein product [Effrenium voratum]|uniref:Trehalose-6-phosphate phosphatase C-terminal domain-containing protein n=1 Tax=Effrenium voratum TaxID=2562239 RepID=A0AA36NLN0_9DINO|nr:unnamed protein product [Effrenium voratum]